MQCAWQCTERLNSPGSMNWMWYWDRVITVYYTKQKHLGCKKVRGQSEATLQTGRRDQKV